MSIANRPLPREAMQLAMLADFGQSYPPHRYGADLREVFGSAAGQRVLAKLLQAGSIFTAVPAGASAEVLGTVDGRRAVVLELAFAMEVREPLPTGATPPEPGPPGLADELIRPDPEL